MGSPDERLQNNSVVLDTAAEVGVSFGATDPESSSAVDSVVTVAVATHGSNSPVSSYVTCPGTAPSCASSAASNYASAVGAHSDSSGRAPLTAFGPTTAHAAQVTGPDSGRPLNSPAATVTADGGGATGNETGGCVPMPATAAAVVASGSGSSNNSNLPISSTVSPVPMTPASSSLNNSI